MVAARGRASSMERIRASSSRSLSGTPRLRHASEQYRTDSQFRAQDFRHVMVRPHDAHTFVRSAGLIVPSARCRALDIVIVRLLDPAHHLAEFTTDGLDGVLLPLGS